MRKIILSLLFLTFATPAFAADVILREDSGLTKMEYFLAIGKYTEAIDTANDVLTRHPANADAYTYRGYGYMRLGQTAQAVKDFQRALTIDPAHLGANKYLADTYLQSGDVPRALEQMQVIHMTCGLTDCEELDDLQHEIDQYKDKKDDKK